ncbi:MAG: 4-hydroxy-tetrahydrodipicolinate synthase [Conexivisphaerales archaeon]
MNGCITAIITPFDRSQRLDEEGFASIIDFQIKNGVSGLVDAGTTGEGPTVTEDEWRSILSIALDRCKGKCKVIANVGANITGKAIHLTEKAAELGCDTVLAVDPYYNAPSSLEIRKEYYEPIARDFPDINVIPYIIPSRTGTQILPFDLYMLNLDHKNINTIKDATGSDAFAREVRSLCGDRLHILSGDDDRTFAMMNDSSIRAEGVISVMSNIAPKAVASMTDALLRGDINNARIWQEKLKPLFQVVTVRSEEVLGNGISMLKFRNPVPVKAMSNILGIPSGPCRQPLGKLTANALSIILDVLRKVWQSSPEVLRPVEESFPVSIEERLESDKYAKGIYYE